METIRKKTLNDCMIEVRQKISQTILLINELPESLFDSSVKNRIGLLAKTEIMQIPQIGKIQVIVKNVAAEAEKTENPILQAKTAQIQTILNNAVRILQEYLSERLAEIHVIIAKDIMIFHASEPDISTRNTSENNTPAPDISESETAIRTALIHCKNLQKKLAEKNNFADMIRTAFNLYSAALNYMERNLDAHTDPLWDSISQEVATMIYILMALN